MVDLVVNFAGVFDLPARPPGEVDCRPPLAVWCVLASAPEQYSPSVKDLVCRARLSGAEEAGRRLRRGLLAIDAAGWTAEEKATFEHEYDAVGIKGYGSHRLPPHALLPGRCAVSWRGLGQPCQRDYTATCPVG